MKFHVTKQIKAVLGRALYLMLLRLSIPHVNIDHYIPNCPLRCSIWRVSAWRQEGTNVMCKYYNICMWRCLLTFLDLDNSLSQHTCVFCCPIILCWLNIWFVYWLYCLCLINYLHSFQPTIPYIVREILTLLVTWRHLGVLQPSNV